MSISPDRFGSPADVDAIPAGAPWETGTGGGTPAAGDDVVGWAAAWFQALYAGTSKGAVLQDAAGHVVEANAAAATILGRTLDDLLGRTSTDPTWAALREDGTDLPGDEHPAMAALRTGQPVHDATMAVFCPPTRSLRWLGLDALPITVPGATQPALVLTIFSDVTARKQAEVERAGLIARERRARQQAEEAATTARRLHAISAAVAQAATPQAVAGVILAQGLAALGARQGSVVLLAEDGATLETLGSVGYPDELNARWQRFPLDAQVPITESVRTGEVVVLRSRQEAATRFPALTRGLQDIETWITFPLLAGGTAIGAVGMSAAERLEVREGDRQLLATLGRQCGQALERARLYEAERRARERAERRATRLDLLHRLSAIMAAAVTADEVAGAITGAVAPALGANGAVMSVLSADGSYFVNTRIAGYDPVVVADWRGYSATLPSPIGDAVKTLEVIVLESPAAYADRYPPGITVEAEGGTSACAAVPLLLGARALGGIGLSFPGVRSFDREDMALLRSVGELCAQALERARLYDAEREVAAALRARTDELETLLRVLPIGIGIANGPAATDIRVNPAFAEMLGITPDVNASLSAPEEERPANFKVYQAGRELAAEELPLQVAAAQRAELRDIEVEVVRDDGTRLTLLEYAAPLYDDAGQVRGAVGAFLNISARVLAERQRDQVMATLAHDLKNPLAALLAMAQLLQRRLGRPEGADASQVAEGVAKIVEAARGMARQIDELLDTARLEARRPLELDPRPVDLAALLRRQVAAQAGASELHAISLHGAEGALVGLYDEARLGRVLANVLGNAAKYSPAGGAVAVELACEEQAGHVWAIIRVRDRGIGIPAAEIGRVTEPYYRASNARGRVEGSGLGLAGARQIVEAHEGTFALESEEGAGTTVTLRLPHRPPAKDAGA